MDRGIKRMMELAEGNVGKKVVEMMNLLDDLEEDYREVDLVKASSELYGLLVRFTTEEAATVVKSVSSMCGVEACGRLYGTYSSRTMGRLFRMRRECMHPKAV